MTERGTTVQVDENHHVDLRRQPLGRVSVRRRLVHIAVV
jgi:hypothetical protein